ncbi:hypothetical protein GJAV_G00162300 [Gymnothorax javanicus]|nr:hypothetical protein GJAV_G00162300 [Gymnothorax javanicus]
MELTADPERVWELTCCETVPNVEEVVNVKVRVSAFLSFQELERVQRERLAPPPEESVMAKEAMPKLQVLSQRAKVLEPTLRDNINTFSESETALQNRIKELEESERNLLVKLGELMARSVSLRHGAPRQRQEEKLQLLREEVRSMALDKERSDRVWKDKLHRCQNQMRVKEVEMKRQSEYFEHYKQKQERKLGFSKEREQALQGRVFQLERQVIDLTASAAQLRTEPRRRAPVAAPPLEAEQEEQVEEKEGGSRNEGRLMSCISSLQADLRDLLGREEAGLAECMALREGLQEAEDNVEFLSHKLEDFRSCVHQLKLSESALLEEVEELAQENKHLRAELLATIPTSDPGLATPCKVEPGHQDLAPVDNSDSMGCLMLGGHASHYDSLDLVRSKAIQTPSITCCIREAITVARLISHLGGSLGHSCEQFLEGSLFPMLESNSWDVVEIMKAMRCGGVEQVKLILEQMESQCRLPVLECKNAPLLAYREGAVGSSKPETVILSKHKQTIVIQSQPDLFNLHTHRNQSAILILLVTKTIDVDCNPSQGGTADGVHSFCSPSFGTLKPLSEQTNSLKETLLILESEVDRLQDNKKELEQVLYNKEEALQKATVEIARLKFGQVAEFCKWHEAAAEERGDLHLETLKNNWRQENKVLGRRNEELLEQIAKLEEDYERELAQLRLHISLQERDISGLEEENRHQAAVIARLQQKMNTDQNEVLDLQQAMWEKGDQIMFPQHRTEEDINITMELQGALREKRSSKVVCQGVGNDQKDRSFISTNQVPEDSVYLEASLEGSWKAQTLLQDERERLQELVDGLRAEQQRDSEAATELRQEVRQLSRLVSKLETELQLARAERDSVTVQKEDLSARLAWLDQSNSSLHQKVAEQQEALKISSEMISDLQTQRDTIASEVVKFCEAHTASQLHPLALKEANEVVVEQLWEQEDVKQPMTHIREERTQLLDEENQLQRLDTELLEQQKKGCQMLREKNKDVLVEMVALEETRRVISEREARLCKEVDSLRRENQALCEQILMLELKTGQEACKDTNALAANGTEFQKDKYSPGADDVMHRPNGSCQSMPKESELENASQSLRHKMAPEASVVSRKTFNLGSTLLEQQTVMGDDGSLQTELQTITTELKQCKEELEKTKAEAQKWYLELGLAESKGEEAEKKASRAVNEAKRMRECVKEAEEMKRINYRLKEEVDKVRTRMTELERGQNDSVPTNHLQAEQLTVLRSQFSAKLVAENELREENKALKSQLDKLEDKSETVRALQVHYDNIRQQFDELLQRKSQTDLDLAPLKKCQERNSLIVRLIRTLRSYGCIDCALTQEAEDLLNDTALQEYSSTFLAAASRTQDACRNVWKTTKMNEEGSAQHSVSCHLESLSDEDTSLSFRLCFAKADYCPSPDMPQTMLPTLPLSAGEAVQVTGVPDSRGLYHAKVKGQAGLVPASFLEEKGNHQILLSAGSDLVASSKLIWPEKISLHQQLPQSDFSNFQVRVISAACIMLPSATCCMGVVGTRKPRKATQLREGKL